MHGCARVGGSISQSPEEGGWPDKRGSECRVLRRSYYLRLHSDTPSSPLLYRMRCCGAWRCRSAPCTCSGRIHRVYTRAWSAGRPGSCCSGGQGVDTVWGGMHIVVHPSPFLWTAAIWNCSGVLPTIVGSRWACARACPVPSCPTTWGVPTTMGPVSTRRQGSWMQVKHGLMPLKRQLTTHHCSVEIRLFVCTPASCCPWRTGGEAPSLPLSLPDLFPSLGLPMCAKLLLLYFSGPRRPSGVRGGPGGTRVQKLGEAFRSCWRGGGRHVAGWAGATAVIICHSAALKNCRSWSSDPPSESQELQQQGRKYFGALRLNSHMHLKR